MALVGPAMYLEGSNLGLEIDSYDLVARINRGVELVDTFENDVGKKTDIVYSCLIEKPANAGIINADELLEKYGVKFLCTPPKSDYSGVSQGDIVHDMAKNETVEEIKRKMGFRVIDYKLNNLIAREIYCRPNTGFLAIYDLLFSKVSQLGLYGFSFYLDGFIKGCKDGIEEEEGKTEQEFSEKCFNSKRHNQENMWAFAKNSLLNNSRVYLDDTLRKILSMNSLDKKEFIELISSQEER